MTSSSNALRRCQPEPKVEGGVEDQSWQGSGFFLQVQNGWGRAYEHGGCWGRAAPSSTGLMVMGDVVEHGRERR
jgi:hypothetical protein